jgi:hypothetical protein
VNKKPRGDGKRFLPRCGGGPLKELLSNPACVG